MPSKLILAFLLVYSTNLSAQSDCRSILKLAESAFQKNKLDDALQKLQDAETCDYKAELVKERQALQQKIFKAIKRQKEEADAARIRAEKAEANALDNARASENAALALQVVRLNETLALRLAEYNLEAHPGNAGAATALQITAELENRFYSFRLEGHEDEVRCIAWSPDGSKLVSGSLDQTAKVWDTNTGKELFNLSGHTNAIHSVAFSNDSTLLASGSQDGTVKLWDTETWKELHTIQACKDTLEFWDEPGFISDVIFTPYHNNLVIANFLGTATVWNLETYLPTDTFSMAEIAPEHYDNFSSFAYAPGERRLAISSEDGAVHIYDTWYKEHFFDLGTHTDQTLSMANGTPYTSLLAFSPDGTTLAVGAYDNSVHVWNLKSRMEQFQLIGHESFICSVAFSPDGSKLATASYDGTAKIWDIATQKELFTLRGHFSAVSALAFSPDGFRLATASHDRTIKIWDLRTPQIEPAYHLQINPIVAFSPDGAIKATVINNNSEKPILRLFDTQKKQLLEDFEGHSLPIRQVAFSPDGKTVATSSDDKTVMVYEPEFSGRLRSRFTGHKTPVIALAYSPDGKLLASGSTDSTIRVGDSEMLFGQELFTLGGQKSGTSALAFSRDGRFLASASFDNTITIWKVASRQKMFTFQAHSSPINTMDFSNDGSKLLSFSYDESLKEWDLQKQAEIATLDYPKRINFEENINSLDGNLRASTSKDHWVRVMDNSTSLRLFILKGQYEPVNFLSFSSDSRRILTSTGGVFSGDMVYGDLKIWDVRPYLSNFVAQCSLQELKDAGAKLTAKDLKILEAAKNK